MRGSIKAALVPDEFTSLIDLIKFKFSSNKQVVTSQFWNKIQDIDLHLVL